MAKGSNIVHQYFRKEMEGLTILVRVNPIQYTGTEITIQEGGNEMRELEFDEEIFEDLKADGFTASSALEFNLYLNGLV
ncbi:hypothetical protein [Dawidia soli]|uniref:Uncharacterized protein n=1 Tax=Dawidia soli TaxID=2782352 RepID=A0AAP2D5C9_9BACT|nr:hypothetical protein [Dawidia soli]MBT1685644.1 hypothetical protein [Dawidia soli]